MMSKRLMGSSDAGFEYPDNWESSKEAPATGVLLSVVVSIALWTPIVVLAFLIGMVVSAFIG